MYADTPPPKKQASPSLPLAVADKTHKKSLVHIYIYIYEGLLPTARSSKHGAPLKTARKDTFYSRFRPLTREPHTRTRRWDETWTRETNTTNKIAHTKRERTNTSHAPTTVRTLYHRTFSAGARPATTPLPPPARTSKLPPHSNTQEKTRSING